MCHEIGGEGISMRYVMKYKMSLLQWAGWPIDGGDKLSEARCPLLLQLATWKRD